MLRNVTTDPQRGRCRSGAVAPRAAVLVNAFRSSRTNASCAHSSLEISVAAREVDSRAVEQGSAAWVRGKSPRPVDGYDPLDVLRPLDRRRSRSMRAVWPLSTVRYSASILSIPTGGRGVASGSPLCSSITSKASTSPTTAASEQGRSQVRCPSSTVVSHRSKACSGGKAATTAPRLGQDWTPVLPTFRRDERERLAKARSRPVRAWICTPVSRRFQQLAVPG